MGIKKAPNKEKFPELRIVRSLWREARNGDAASEAKLLLFLSQYKTVDDFVRRFAHMKINSSPPSGFAIIKPKSPATAWEKGRTNFQSGPTSVVRGGLPSLGKGSK